MNSEAWDDSVLIEAFDQAVRSFNNKSKAKATLRKFSDRELEKLATRGSVPTAPDSREDGRYRTKQKPRRKSSRTGIIRAPDEDDTQSNRTATPPIPPPFFSVHESAPSTFPIPPPPPLPFFDGGDHGDLKELLMSWYQVGYRTGYYCAQNNTSI